MTQTAAYIATGTNVINRVEKLAEFVPSVAFNTDVEFDPSLADPTLGSVVFYIVMEG